MTRTGCGQIGEGPPAVRGWALLRWPTAGAVRSRSPAVVAGVDLVEADGLADRAAEQLGQAAHQLARVHRAWRERLAPAEGTRAHDEYLVWLHYGEGSAMLPLMLQLYTGRLGEGAAPLKPRIDSEIARHLGYVESCLVGKEWLVGGELTGEYQRING